MLRELEASCRMFTLAKHLAEASLVMIEALGTCSRQQILHLQILRLSPTSCRNVLSKRHAQDLHAL